MNSKRDSKKNKQKQEQKFLSPVPKKAVNDTDLNPLNLRDLSPFRPIYGSHHTPNHIQLSNTELTIIETPANTFPRVSYLEQIDEGHRPISGIIDWERGQYDDSQHSQQESEIMEMSEDDSKKQEQNQIEQTTRKIQEKGGNQNLRTAQPKQKRDSHKKAVQVENTANGNKKVFCNCKKTKCLKLYCDCFRINQTCDGCNCVGCHNLSIYEQQRNNAMLTLMDRNPEAFKPKIDEQQHAKGCHCKKSNCLKKYCECFQAGLKCGINCKCEECKNRTQEDHQQDQPDPNNALSLHPQPQYSIVISKEKEDKQERRPIRTASVKKDRKIQQWAIRA